ncbi:hypothetical protein EG832_20110 [bacterium]|nr:hypothetical protein [bacterium]
MSFLKTLEPVDYLVIGHITQDVVAGGLRLGGTVSYAALTAKAMGLRVGIVTAYHSGFNLDLLNGISIVAKESSQTSTFENIATPEGRIQILHHRACGITAAEIPDDWKKTPIVHLGPVVQELDDTIIHAFPNSFIGITPQGWLRQWDSKGHVSLKIWEDASKTLPFAAAVVMSIEDVQNDETQVEKFLSLSRVLVVTEGAAGARLYWNGDMRYFKPPRKQEIDPVGAGDIFATVFFIRLQQTHDPWEAARFATLLAANSVTRKGLEGVPNPEEVTQSLIEVLPDYNTK